MKFLTISRETTLTSCHGKKQRHQVLLEITVLRLQNGWAWMDSSWKMNKTNRVAWTRALFICTETSCSSENKMKQFCPLEYRKEIFLFSLFCRNVRNIIVRFRTKLQCSPMKYASVSLGNEMERSFPLESFQMVHYRPALLCLFHAFAGKYSHRFFHTRGKCSNWKWTIKSSC